MVSHLSRTTGPLHEGPTTTTELSGEGGRTRLVVLAPEVCGGYTRQTCTFERPGFQKHHQNSTQGPQEREKRMRTAAGENQGPAEGVVADFGQTDFGQIGQFLCSSVWAQFSVPKKPKPQKEPHPSGPHPSGLDGVNSLVLYFILFFFEKTR